MNETMMQKVNKAGDIHHELSEIKKMQKEADTFLSIWSEGCATLYSVICC